MNNSARQTIPLTREKMKPSFMATAIKTVHYPAPATAGVFNLPVRQEALPGIF
jgi:hypothetical protein